MYGTFNFTFTNLDLFFNDSKLNHNAILIDSNLLHSFI